MELNAVYCSGSGWSREVVGLGDAVLGVEILRHSLSLSLCLSDLSLSGLTLSLWSHSLSLWSLSDFSLCDTSIMMNALKDSLSLSVWSLSLSLSLSLRNVYYDECVEGQSSGSEGSQRGRNGWEPDCGELCYTAFEDEFSSKPYMLSWSWMQYIAREVDGAGRWWGWGMQFLV